MRRRNRWALFLGVATLLFGFGTIARSSSADSLEYVSDYFSFVGSDSMGRVAFALDNNRGRDGDRFQAEHFGVLHDEREGWQPLVGNGAYPNPAGNLLNIPNSDAFQFAVAETGGTIRSPANDILLAHGSLTSRLTRKHKDSAYQMASGPARMQWRGRILTGRVIHEWLHLRGSNRLARVETGLLRDFQGFYLHFQTGDFYLHSQAKGPLSTLLGEVDGFVLPYKDMRRLDRAKVRVLSRRWARGFYRWPTEWEIRWPEESTPLRLKLAAQKVIANWVIGGFSMGVVSGHTRIEGRDVPYYGLVELIQ